jgi:hypothetical protein
MNLIIRGHVRDSFKDNRLHDLLCSALQLRPELKVFVHAWNVKQTSLSWRKMKDDLSSVNEHIIREYFDDHICIKKIMIEDDTNVNLLGRVNGTVASTSCPIKGYKLMFYGMLKGSEMVSENSKPEEITIQTRFDILSNWVRADSDSILNFFKEVPSSEEPIRFMIRPGRNKRERDLRFDRWMKYGPEYERHWTCGVENIFMATVKNMKDFLDHMYINFDSINEKYSRFNHQEWLPMFEAFNPIWVE